MQRRCSFGRKRLAGAKNRGMHRSCYWLTIAQVAVPLNVSTAEIRKRISNGELGAVDIDSFDVHLVTRDSVEAVKQQRARAVRDW